MRLTNTLVETVIPKAIVGLGSASCWLLNTLVPERAWQRICAETSGHHFVTEALHLEDQSAWVIDPNTSCQRCALPMPDSVYESITAAYTLALADEDVW